LVLYWLDLFGVAVFAVTGSLAARRKQLDLFGVLVIALVTALGGGTLRDMLLGRSPVFWVQDSSVIVIASVAALLTVVAARWNLLPARPLLLADALGLAVFSVLGTQTALESDVNALAAIIMGVMTGVAGGIIRDLLTGEIPLILQREIYATAALCGSVALIVAIELQLPAGFAELLGVTVTLVLRLAAIWRGWRLPQFT
jgi:uncharacterized membrane protein YeiH